MPSLVLNADQTPGRQGGLARAAWACPPPRRRSPPVLPLLPLGPPPSRASSSPPPGSPQAIPGAARRVAIPKSRLFWVFVMLCRAVSGLSQEGLLVAMMRGSPDRNSEFQGPP